MIKCSGCNRKLYDKVKKCPNCGTPTEYGKGVNETITIIMVCVIIMIIVCVLVYFVFGRNKINYVRIRGSWQMKNDYNKPAELRGILSSPNHNVTDIGTETKTYVFLKNNECKIIDKNVGRRIYVKKNQFSEYMDIPEQAINYEDTSECLYKIKNDTIKIFRYEEYEIDNDVDCEEEDCEEDVDDYVDKYHFKISDEKLILDGETYNKVK